MCITLRNTNFEILITEWPNYVFVHVIQTGYIKEVRNWLYAFV